MLKKLFILASFFVIQMKLPISEAYGTTTVCPLTITSEGNATVISGNFLKFKIEPQWLKVQAPQPLTTEHPWTFAPRNNSASRVGVYFERGQSSSFAGELYVMNDSWYLVAKDRFGWLKAALINGSFTCSYVNSADEARLKLSNIQREHISSADLRVTDPEAMTVALGLE